MTRKAATEQSRSGESTNGDGAVRLMAAIRSAERPALGVFISSGFPELNCTLPLLRAIDAGGADFIELGMPFSDPLAEGGPIQRSSARALAAGITMKRTFDTVHQFRTSSDTPLVLMGYANPVHRYGIGNFFDDARSSGVDGVILPDVPLDESDRFVREASRTGTGLIFLVSPTTPEERMERIAAVSTGFVYAVTMTSVTGSALADTDAIASYLRRAQSRVGSLPLLAGFGIRTHEDVRRLSEHTDGAIVGSALSVFIEQLWESDSTCGEDDPRLERVRRFVHELKYG